MEKTVYLTLWESNGDSQDPSTFRYSLTAKRHLPLDICDLLRQGTISFNDRLFECRVNKFRTDFKEAGVTLHIDAEVVSRRGWLQVGENPINDELPGRITQILERLGWRVIST